MKRFICLFVLLFISTNAYAIRDKIRFVQGRDVASSSKLILTEGNAFDVTGTTTIATIAHKEIGAIILLEFDGILTLTHSTDLYLPTESNITTAAGDIAVFYEYARGDWRCFSYMRANGNVLASGSVTITGGTITGITDLAVADGGTGASTLTDHCVLVGSGTSAITAITAGTTKQVLKGSTSADPTFATERCFSTQNHTSTGNVTEAQILASKWHTNNGASAEIDLTLPALSYTVSIVFIVQETQIIEINPPSGELFDLDGTDLDANDCIDTSAVVGDKIALTRMLIADGSTWRWSADTIRGVHVDTGASD